MRNITFARFDQEDDLRDLDGEIRFMLALSLSILLLLSSSLESSASTLGRIEPANETFSQEIRKFDIHVKKGGGGGGDGNGDGSGGGTSYKGVSFIYLVHVGANGHKPSNGTQRSSTIKFRSSSLASIVFVPLYRLLCFKTSLIANCSVYLIEGILLLLFYDFLFQYEMKEKEPKSSFYINFFFIHSTKKRNKFLFLSIYIFLITEV